MAEKLTREAFERAKIFIEGNARAIDQAFFSLFCQSGKKERVESALKDFQNEDGGFGNCLEPDFRLKESSVLATNLAFKFLIEAEIEATSHVVRRGIEYLTANIGENGWEPVPKAIDDVPRAPWWQYENWANREGISWLNPNAETISILLHYKSLVPVEMIEPLLAKVESILDENPDKMEMHDFLATLPLAERASGDLRERLYDHLKKHINSIVAFDEQSWATYGLKPYWVVEKPDSPLLTSLGTSLERSLTFEIEHQGKDGSWSPNWAWGQFEDEWPRAKKEWQGSLTVKVIKALMNFGKIE